MKHTYTRRGVNTNEVAKPQEESLLLAMKRAMNTLQGEYPEWKFVHEKSIKLTPFKSNRRIVPDGGVIYAVKDGKKRFVVSSEKKYQKAKNANAFERVWDNEGFMEVFFHLNEIKSIPYAVFCDGLGFGEKTRPREKVEAKLEAKKIKNDGVIPSFFMREEEWTEDEMFNECLNIGRNTMAELC